MGKFFTDLIRDEGAKLGGLSQFGDLFKMNGMGGQDNQNQEGESASQGSDDTDNDKERANAMPYLKTWSHINENELLPIMYKTRHKVTADGDEGYIMDETVYRYSHLWMPKSVKKKQKMLAFNNKVIEKAVVKEPAENAADARQKRRKIKEEWKDCIKRREHASEFANPAENGLIDPHLFLKLNANNKYHAKKKLVLKQAQAKHFQATGRQALTSNALLTHVQPVVATVEDKQEKAEKVIAQVQPARMQTPIQQTQKNIQACQITELEPAIFEFNLNNDSNAPEEVFAQDLEFQKSESRRQIKRELDQKYPTYNFIQTEKDCYSFLHSLGEADQPQGQQDLAQTPSQVEAGVAQFLIKNPLTQAQAPIATEQIALDQQAQKPSDHKLQEWVVAQNFANLNENQSRSDLKRKRYWGELEDCSSAHQIQKDELQLQSIKRDNKGSQAIFTLTRTDKLPVKIQPIDNYEEYCSVKQRESKLYSDLRSHQQQTQLKPELRQSEKLTTNKVTASSIMRHIKWKRGELTDKEFYALEYQEAKELEQESHVTQRNGMRKNFPEIKASVNKMAFQGGQNFDQKGEDQKNNAFNFDENFDNHFNSRQEQLRYDIFSKWQKKQRATDAHAKTSVTTAYKDVDKTIVRNVAQQQNQDNPSMINTKGQDGARSSSKSSSDSDTDPDDADNENAKRNTQSTMRNTKALPTLGEELNHAKCIKDLAYCKLNWSVEELNRFHRPDITQLFKKANGEKMQGVPKSSQKETQKSDNLNPHDHFNTRFRLSLRDGGKFCVFEHIDQHPLFVNNFGMASRLKRFYYGDREPHSKEFKQKTENKGTRHMGPHGNLELKKQGEKLNLLGQLQSVDEYKGVTILDNNMYSAPVFYHTADRQDFFCSVHLNKDGIQTVVIRELDFMYTVGQIEPKKEVLNPQSRNYQNFIKRQCTAYIIRDLEEKQKDSKTSSFPKDPKVDFNEIKRKFPDINEAILKKGLKDYDIEVTRDGACRFQKNFEVDKFKDRMTPENICQYETARFGQNRLHTLGIERILDANKISYSTNKFCDEETDVKLKRIAKLIESEVICTPWNLSSSYIKIRQEGSMMMLEKTGDPSFGKGGYSFIKMPLKISSDSLGGARGTRMHLNPAIQNPRAVTGTSADLRKLKKKVIKQKLLDMGYAENELQSLTRWQMISHLRCNAPQHENNQQYIRGVRYDSRKQQQVYNEKANNIFSLQMKNLSEINPGYCNFDYSEPEPDFISDELEIDRLNYLKVLKKKPEKVGKNATIYTQDLLESAQQEQKKFSVEDNNFREITCIQEVPKYQKLLLSQLSSSQMNAPGQGMLTIQGQQENQKFGERFEKDPEGLFQEKLRNGECKFKSQILRKKIRSISTVNLEVSKNQLDFQRIIYTADEKTIRKFTRCREKMKGKSQRTGYSMRKTHNPSQYRRARATRSIFDNVEGTEVSGGQESGAASKSRKAGLTLQNLEQLNQPKGGASRGNGGANNSRSASRNRNKGGLQINIGSSKVGDHATKEKTFIFKASNKEAVHTKTKLSFGISKNDDQGDSDQQSDDDQYDDDLQEEESSYGDQQQEQKQNILKQAALIARKANRADQRAAEKEIIFKAKPISAPKKKPEMQRFKSAGSGCLKDDYEYNTPQQKSQRTRQRQCDSELNSIFESFIDQIEIKDKFYVFQNVPTFKELPDYKDRVAKPIALRDMKMKTKRFEYKNSQQLLADFTLMRTNAESYNGVAHYISAYARGYEDDVRELIQSRQDDIQSYELLIKETLRV